MTTTAARDQQQPLLVIPPATTATPDLICWFWAAFTPRRGQLHVRTLAGALGVSPTTIRRWVREASHTQLDHHTRMRLRQRAILRGRGHYLWPELDPTSRQRAANQLFYALHAHELIATEPERIPTSWRKDKRTLQPHLVHLIHWRYAHAYGVAITTHHKSDARIHRYGEILETVTAPNLYTARAITELTLRTRDEHRCITPNELVPTARTKTWLEAAGPSALHEV